MLWQRLQSEEEVNTISHIAFQGKLKPQLSEKECRFSKSTNSVLKPSCPIYFVIHSKTRFLISSPSPLRWGKAGMGVDIMDLPPHLNPPPPWGEEVIFLTQLGLNSYK